MYPWVRGGFHTAIPDCVAGDCAAVVPVRYPRPAESRQDGGVTERLWIRTTQGPDELRSLHDWLSYEEALRGHVCLVLHPIEPDQMGGVLDALVVAVGSGGMLAVLAGALSTWVAQRRSDIKLTVISEDGRTVELDAKRVDHAVMMRDIERLLEAREPPE